MVVSSVSLQANVTWYNDREQTHTHLACPPADRKLKHATRTMTVPWRAASMSFCPSNLPRQLIPRTRAATTVLSCRLHS